MKTIAALVALALVLGCNAKQSDSGHNDEPAQETSTQEPAPSEGDSTTATPTPETPPEPPAPMLRELARVETPGYVYALAIDTDGNVVATTRRGRAAAYFISPSRDDPHRAPADLELPGHAIAPIALDRRRFALLLQATAQVAVAEAGGDLVTAPTLSLAQTISVEGKPADAALAFGSLWLAVRGAPNGRGLIRIDPASGEVLQDIATGPTPVQLNYRPPHNGGGERLELVAIADEGSNAIFLEELPLATGPQAPGVEPSEPTGEVTRLAIAATTVGLVAGPPGGPTWAMLAGDPTLIRLEAEKPALGQALTLPVEPRTVVVDDSRLLVAHGDGRLLAVDPTGSAPPIEQKLGRGTVQLEPLPSRDLVAALDPEARAVVLLARSDLSEVSRLALEGVSEVGRMVVDESRGRVYVSLPLLQEVAVLAIE